MTQLNHSHSSVQRIPDYNPSAGPQARIISYNQDAPTQGSQQNNQQGNDPFDDPPPDILGSENRNNRQDPFADPPADILQNQQLPDPFDDPPADMRGQDSQPTEQQPAEQAPDQPPPRQDPLQGVDPFPITPNDLDPNAPPPPETEPRDPGDARVAPGRTPQQDRRPRYRTGPYESFNGHQPKRLLPAPPDREYPSFSQPIAQPFYQYDQMDDMLNQPTLMADGFETGQLYEGITYDHDARLASYECDACNARFAKRRMPIIEGLKSSMAKFTRIGCYDHRISRVTSCDSCDCSGVVSQQPLFNEPAMMSEMNCGDCGSCEGCQFGGLNMRAKLAGLAARRSVFEEPMTNGGCCCEPMFYYALFGGYTDLGDFTSQTLVNPPDRLPDDGFGLGAALGQWQGRNLRSEIEYVFRSNDISSSQFIGLQSAQDELDTHAGILNLYWDFNRHVFGCRPYIGAGIGFVFYDYDAGGSIAAPNVADSSFAYQWIIGFSRCWSCQKDWFVEYRRFTGDEFTSDMEYKSDNVFFGFRKRF